MGLMKCERLGSLRFRAMNPGRGAPSESAQVMEYGDTDLSRFLNSQSELLTVDKIRLYWRQMLEAVDVAPGRQEEEAGELR